VDADTKSLLERREKSQRPLKNGSLSIARLRAPT